MRVWVALGVLFIGLFLLLFVPSPKQRTVSQAPLSVSSSAGSEFRAGETAPIHAEPQTDSVPPQLAPSTTNAAISDSWKTLAQEVIVPPVPPTAESTNLPPETVLENMRTLIRQYGSTFNGNPVGNNAEIAKALQGDNPKQMNFLKPDDGNRLNSSGELVDVWGTPYFFHQLSGIEMEIRSAGPDRKMWTGDDLAIR